MIKNEKERSSKIRKVKETTNLFITKIISGLNSQSIEDKDALKKLKNTFYCCNELKTNINKDHVKYKYCKNRFCITCRNIRIAKILHKIKESGQVFDQWKVIKININSSYEGLKKTTESINKLLKSWRNLQTGKNIKSDSFRSFEFIYNDPENITINCVLVGREEYVDNINNYLKKRLKDIKIEIEEFKGDWKNQIKHIAELNYNYPSKFYSKIYSILKGLRQYQASGCLYGLNIKSIVKKNEDLEEKYLYNSIIRDWENSKGLKFITE